MTTQQNANTNPVIAAKAAIQKLRRSRASHPEPTNTPVIPAKAGTHGPDSPNNSDRDEESKDAING